MDLKDAIKEVKIPKNYHMEMIANNIYKCMDVIAPASYWERLDKLVLEILLKR